jgi:hypothetical protein
MTRLWHIPLVAVVRNNSTNTVIVNRPPTEFLTECPPPTDAIHNVYELNTQPELVRYYHAAAGFPKKTTWAKAVRNKQFASWPGLTVDTIKRHYPDSEETPKGHGRKVPSGLVSTKQTTLTLDNGDEALDSQTNTTPRPTKKECTIFICVLDMEDEATQKIFTDQPGRFPKKSSRGNQYIMVLREIDSDSILIEPMKNRTTGKMIRAYQTLIDCLRTAGIIPELHILDNECSKDFKDTIHLNETMFQLIPLHNHWRTLVEKAIQNFKDHFIAILCRADKSFSLNLWDRLLLQAEHTVNILRPSQMTPTISAYAYLLKKNDYNANPVAPLGCKVKAHLVPSNRQTWAPHTTSGFYIGNVWDHYHCHEIYINNTRHTRTCNTVFFKHKYLTIPTLTPTNALIQAADNLTSAIAGVVPPPNMTTDAINQLMHIFKQQAKTVKNNETFQRVLKKCAHAERVCTKAEINPTPTTTPSAEPTTNPTITFPELEIEYLDMDVGQPRQTPVVSQDDYESISSPAANTHHQCKGRTMTEDFLFHIMDVPTCTQPFTNQQAASCKFPLKFLCNFASAVLDNETGDLLEYCHLLKHPKYKDVWGKSFGKEI